MKDTEEKEEQKQKANGEQSTHEQQKSTEDSNWAENQQVDEEGAEIEPDDVK
jgi:hypothetical protein